jgi:DNA-binding NarL/FixJ family response regulator
MPAVRVLIVDDFESFREVTCRLLQGRFNDWTITEASDGCEAVRNAQQLRPDLILLDIGLPKMNGMNAARKMRIVSPNSKIIFVSQETSLDVIEECLRLGASGYVSKGRVGTHLLNAIDAVLQDKQFVGIGLL